MRKKVCPEQYSQPSRETSGLDAPVLLTFGGIFCDTYSGTLVGYDTEKKSSKITEKKTQRQISLMP